MHKILYFGLLLVTLVCPAQSTFRNTYRTPTNDLGKYFQQTPDSGFIIAGREPFSLAYLLKTDKVGAVQWAKGYSSDSIHEEPRCVQQTSDGGYITCGKTITFNGATSLWNFLIKTDSAGNVQWAKTYNAGQQCVFYSVRENSIGFIVAGSYYDSTSYSGAYLTQLALDGNVIWSRIYSGDHSYSYREVNEIQLTADGNAIAVGTYTDTSIGIWVAKIDTTGNIMWDKRYNLEQTVNQYRTWGRSIWQATDGGYIVAGGGDPNGGLPVLLKIDATGNVLWAKQYNSNVEPSYVFKSFMDVCQSNNGDYFATVGLGWDIYSGSFITKLNSSGDVLWCKDYERGAISSSCIQSTNDDGLVACGAFYYSIDTNYYYDLCLFKTDANGNGVCDATDNITTTIVATALIKAGNTLIHSLPNPTDSNIVLAESSVSVVINTDCSVGINDLKLNENLFELFPNPSIDQLNITVDESLTNAQLNLYNLSGALVQTEQLQAASTIINTANYASGVYIVEIKTIATSVKRKWIKM